MNRIKIGMPTKGDMVADTGWPIPILIDHDLSREIGHVGYYHFTHADTLEARNDG